MLPGLKCPSSGVLKLHLSSSLLALQLAMKFINRKIESSMHTSTPVIGGGGGGGGGGLERAEVDGWGAGVSGWVGAGVDGCGSYIKDTSVENCSTDALV